MAECWRSWIAKRKAVASALAAGMISELGTMGWRMGGNADGEDVVEDGWGILRDRLAG